MLVPREGRGEVRQIELSLRSLQRLLVGVGVGGGLLVAALLAGLFAWGRAGSGDELAKENLFLRSRLEDVESKLTRVDASIRRLMLYDSELRKSLGEAPARAPVPAEPEAPSAPAEEPSQEEDPGPSGSLLIPAGDAEGTAMDEALPEDPRSATEWASAIVARTDGMLARLSQLEPRLSALAEDVHDFIALSESFPSLWPVEGVLTSGFGYRNAPFGHRRKFHSGIDVGADRGQQVVAAASGTVEKAEWHSGYGRMVIIDHGYGIRTLYGHNSSVFVHPGEHVDQGQLIAAVGSTGQSTGPHLHFEVWLDGEPVDPLDYLPR